MGTEIFFEKPGSQGAEPQPDKKWIQLLDQGWDRQAALDAAAQFQELKPQVQHAALVPRYYERVAERHHLSVMRCNVPHCNSQVITAHVPVDWLLSIGQLHSWLCMQACPHRPRCLLHSKMLSCSCNIVCHMSSCMVLTMQDAGSEYVPLQTSDRGWSDEPCMASFGMQSGYLNPSRKSWNRQCFGSY